MKFRIIRKTIDSYEPAYYFQERYLAFWWITIFWGPDYDHIKQLAEARVARLQQKPVKDKVLWEVKL